MTEYEAIGNWHYRVVKESATWYDAKKLCLLEGGQLMVAHNDLFQTHLELLFRRHGNTNLLFFHTPTVQYHQTAVIITPLV